MNVEQLSTMTESELRSAANDHFELVDKTKGDDAEKARYISLAQVYLNEIERRKLAQARADEASIADRDYRLEKWVIVLIGAELVIAVLGIFLGWIEGDKQMKILNKQTEVLDKLNQSSAATASVLNDVRRAQEASLETQRNTLGNMVAMNREMQDEMDLNFANALQCAGQAGEGFEIYVRNDGKADLFLWGIKVGGDQREMLPQGAKFPPGARQVIDARKFIRSMFGNRGMNGSVQIPFELYLKAPTGKKYVAESTLAITKWGDQSQLSTNPKDFWVGCQFISTVPKEW
jgi:hypothetical protein